MKTFLAEPDIEQLQKGLGELVDAILALVAKAWEVGYKQAIYDYVNEVK